ncbi:MAG: hypothetical protein KGJ57_19965 [Sphingomonadales bacterium]|nr:hypothetical protein [Sphingomonadales bacterium]MDE2171672.1 hypothetical protein [Sphingomonadales bacterium]
MMGLGGDTFGASRRLVALAAVPSVTHGRAFNPDLPIQTSPHLPTNAYNRPDYIRAMAQTGWTQLRSDAIEPFYQHQGDK